MLSLLIRDALVVDGSGQPGRRADVAVSQDRVAAVAERIDERAERVVEADGRVVCPGFIDLHSHVDLTLPDYPRVDGMIRQGVTTLVTGNCGLSPYPGSMDLAGFAAVLGGVPLAVHVAPLVGHGAIREAAMADPSGTPSEGEMTRMVELVETAMTQGAHGLSTGLIYDPGRFAGTAELVALARVVAAHGGFYASHVRDEGDGLVEAIAEAIAIGRTAGLPVQLSHHKAKRRRNWGRVAATLGMVDRARADGLDVMLDCYPYTASSTGLWAYAPNWWRPGDEVARERVQAGLEERFPGCTGRDGARTDLSDLVLSGLTGVGRLQRYEGMWLDDAAREENVSPADLVIDLLSTAEHVQVIDHAMSEADVWRVLAHPECAVGSDARLIHPDMPGVPHPRNFGTFPRVLGRLPLEEAVRKCTGLPARRMGWCDRGLLRPGAVADLLLFDPDAIGDRATFEEPRRYATGIDLVVVGGEVVIDGSDDTGAAAGRVLLRTGCG